MNPKLKEKLLESLMAVLPITLIVLALSVALVPMDVGTAVMFTVGAVLLVFGMGLFQLGAEMAMTPLGEGIGVQMERVKKIPLIVAIAFVMGVIITIAEPDLQVLAQQVPSIPNKVLIYSVAVGVGAFLALAVVRILKRISLSKLLVVLYGLLAAVSIFVPERFLAVAYDSGGVTTGPITVPFIMAMGVGMAAVRGDKNAASDSFGLVALSSIGPILAVLLLGCARAQAAEIVTTSFPCYDFARQIAGDAAQVQEVIRLANLEGVPLPPDNDVRFIDAMMPTFNPDGMPSMRQDVLAKRPTEVEEFAGVVRQRAKKYGMPTPANDFFYTRIREIEAGYDQ